MYTRHEVLALLADRLGGRNRRGRCPRLPRERRDPRERLARYVGVPSGFSVFAGDVVRPPRASLDHGARTVYATEPPWDGHFAPFEQPESYAHELRSFVEVSATTADRR
ncbi:hypothetical protein [Cellulosimicrobium sp. SH8]|uniref:hypothetical protein n=1 Tax=Cellulosimicrobium sp. SH8 TaxID=2952936 RepID=UPI0021F31B78|nr:hypothetical protein [Cellulosimicrobium sp. SH8]